MRTALSSRRGAIGLTITVLLVIFVLVGAIAAKWAYVQYVVREPGDHIEKSSIQALISRESTVFYADEKTRMGAFFSDQHRLYVEWKDIPRAWADAIVSSEDQNYWDHTGVDPEGLARATWLNLKAGGVVAGGSTLTMQTAENLFHPTTGRTLAGKMGEIVDTWRLEERYTKEEILEFYANQFHVYGNGRGIGVAARYFFDKEAKDLTLQECAFIAGLVKIPNRYNPWIGDTEEARQAARVRARERTSYVLRRLMEDGKITAQQFEQYKDQDLPFKKGEFRFERSVLLDEVEARLERSPFPEILASAGIENPSTAGIQVVTTVDEGVQRSSTWALWHHLSDAGGAIEKPVIAQKAKVEVSDQSICEPPPGAPMPSSCAQRWQFRYAEIKESKGEVITLDLGGFPGQLDEQALKRAAQWGSLGDEGLRAQLKSGAVVWVSLREKQGPTWICDLEWQPRLQGALVVLEEGQVRAMVGGSDNKNFNRATEARRQFGSTWKSLVYNAALQLGWTPLDALDNRRGVFTFTGTWYYPRPDHASEPFVSLGWAGVRSENLASIWLLYHLTDRLNPEQVRRLAKLVDLAPRDGESQADFATRMRDEHGVIATSERLDEALFAMVKDQVIADLPFTGHPEDAVEVRSLHYGRGFAKELQKTESSAPGKERDARLAALDANLLHLEALLPTCKAQLGLLQGSAPVDPAKVDRLSVLTGANGTAVACGRRPEGWTPAAELAPRIGEPGLTVLGDPLLDGRLHASTVEALRKAIEQRKAVYADTDPYGEELLPWNPDFRVLLGMRYLAGLAKAYGVEGELPPVLSMPLGALDVSLMEVAGIYQGFWGGNAYTFPGTGYEASSAGGLRTSFDVPSPTDSDMLIAVIKDADGEVLYRAETRPEAVADPVAGALTVDILRNVVRHGTGRRAADLAPEHLVGGKTGTTNDYKNAAFVGHVSAAKPGKHNHFYTVAAYVGYDDNKPMTKGGTRLQGASGALPAWMGAVDGLVTLGKLGEAEASATPEGFARAPVVDQSGLPGGSEEARSILVEGAVEAPRRRFAPFTQRAESIGEGLEANPQAADQPVEGEEPVDTGDDVVPRLGSPASIWDGIRPSEETPTPELQP